MWFKTDKQHTDKISEFYLGEYNATLENTMENLDVLMHTFVGKDVNDDLNSMHQYLSELSTEIKQIVERRRKDQKTPIAH